MFLIFLGMSTSSASGHFIGLVQVLCTQPRPQFGLYDSAVIPWAIPRSLEHIGQFPPFLLRSPNAIMCGEGTHGSRDTHSGEKEEEETN